MLNDLRRVCVYCGSSAGSDPAYRAVAAALGDTLARRGIGVVYGGASVGLMGAVADAALAAGGEVIGVLPSLLDTRELAHAGLTRLEVVGSMHERKAAMVELSDAFIALPGGYGTLDELMEVLTWGQLGLHRKPIGVVDFQGFYTGLLHHVDHAVSAGLIREEHRALLVSDADPVRLVDRLLVAETHLVPKWAAAPTAPAEHLPTKEGYDRWAEVYDADANPLIELEEARVENLLGSVSDLDVLDVGCGTGRHALRLAAQGARVTAVDFSEGMLEKARRKPGAERVDFRVHDLAQPLPFPPHTFDRIVCGLVLDHVSDLEAFFANIRRVLRPGGSAVVSVMHPAMLLRGESARFSDPTTGAQVYPRSVPNQLSDYVMASSRAGMRIDHISEHTMDPTTAVRSPRAARFVGWPALVLLRLLPDA